MLGGSKLLECSAQSSPQLSQLSGMLPQRASHHLLCAWVGKTAFACCLPTVRKLSHCYSLLTWVEYEAVLLDMTSLACSEEPTTIKPYHCPSAFLSSPKNNKPSQKKDTQTSSYFGNCNIPSMACLTKKCHINVASYLQASTLGWRVLPCRQPKSMRFNPQVAFVLTVPSHMNSATQDANPTKPQPNPNQTPDRGQPSSCSSSAATFTAAPKLGAPQGTPPMTPGSVVRVTWPKRPSSWHIWGSP